ncbi:hypothetical protein NGK36_21085 [Hafnia alvei]|uniref:hypothetical protein n=1 Tax=Hafnia alvei TaxID=569 RepID=UPI002DBE6FE9|nr:hypothetical protein [Hafnia alvei]MEB7891759.1 hypothetical protein [Hafnia alvei]
MRRSDPRRLTQLVAPKLTGTPSFTQPRNMSAPIRGRAAAWQVNGTACCDRNGHAAVTAGDNATGAKDATFLTWRVCACAFIA